ncbi:transcription initiation factor iih tfiih polypeptide 3-related [Anaeramoeba flamelloides]|uniref:Transcription initiation factor iih tfiih polypeptide 3-related n=1 Tax=Anaeramoeba flamelloides TaxID=1746091 RepID=A0AAV8ADV9_9EUKA|nr:transcription initiation factor iih tfiih polypeptide 3-related [Anaeramoeba flamelloides]
MTTLLCVVLDINQENWDLPKTNNSMNEENGSLELGKFLDKFFVFLKTFLLLDPQNEFSLFLNSSSRVELIYPKPQQKSTGKKSKINEMKKERTMLKELYLKRISQQKHRKKNQLQNKQKEQIQMDFGGGGGGSGEDEILRMKEKSSFEKEIKTSISDFLTNLKPNSVEGKTTSLSESLSRVLCYINSVLKKKERQRISQQQSSNKKNTTNTMSLNQKKILSTEERVRQLELSQMLADSALRPRIMVVQLSKDVPSQYVPVMNCIFASQKIQIPIDALVLSKVDSMFLQQASHITEGVYYKTTRQTEILQILLTNFIVDHWSRRFLKLPKPSNIDYRATCFDNQKVVELGYVCSVCLSIFSKYSVLCPNCHTRFPIKKIDKIKFNSKK